MDEKTFDLIDKYLRKELSPVESLNFEQDALNNPELRKEIELTYRIKKSLIDRQHKLHKTAQWGRKKIIKISGIITISSIAAILVIGFFISKPIIDTPNINEILITSTSVENTEELKELNEKAIATVKKSISEGKEEIAIAEVSRLEELDIIPTLNEISEGNFVMSQTMDTEDVNILRKNAYELHWLKIQSLITIGKKAEAMNLLKAFVTVEGTYKASADSLLHEMK